MNEKDAQDILLGRPPLPYEQQIYRVLDLMRVAVAKTFHSGDRVSVRITVDHETATKSWTIEIPCCRL